MYSTLSDSFFQRNPEIVAKELLGKKIIRIIHGVSLEGNIVETEAYLGSDDPASRAFRGMKTFNRHMWGKPGTVFIYNVHKYWMFNIVAHKPNKVGATLIRALEPTKGIEIMKKYRPVKQIENLTSGPGKLTIAFNINKRLNGSIVTSKNSKIMVSDDNNLKEIHVKRSHRIGVKRDLDKKLRFFIEGNKFVSRKSNSM